MNRRKNAMTLNLKKKVTLTASQMLAENNRATA